MQTATGKNNLRGTILLSMFSDTRGAEIADAPLNHTERHQFAGLIDRQGGMLLESDGRRILGFFPQTTAALAAARQLHQSIEQLRTGKGERSGLMVKSALGFGDVVIDNGRLSSDWVYKQISWLTQIPALAIGASQVWLGQHGNDDSLHLRPTAVAQVVLLNATESQDETRLASVLNLANTGMFMELTLRVRGIPTQFRTSDCPILIGRDRTATVNVHSDTASRLHGRIDFEHGKFMYVDLSRNGSYVLTASGEELRLKKGENIALAGEGAISCGATLSDQTGDVVRYHCKSSRLSLAGNRQGDTRPLSPRN